MTFKQFRWWCSLGIVLLAMIGCGRTIKSQQTTAVTPTPLNTPTFDGSTVTLSGELALGLETAVVPKPTTSVIPHTPPTSVPDGNPSPVPTATATSFSYNTTRPIPTPIPLSAIELQATIIARPRTYDSFTSISVQEEMAFLGYGEYLVILDISTPSQPTLMSEIPLQNHIKQIQVISDTVYIVLEVSGGPDETQIELQIVDVTDPLNPFKQGVYRPAFLAVDAVVIGKVAHVIGLENYWEIVGISNPNAPNKIGTIREGYTTGYTDRCSGCTILRNIKEIEGYLHLFSLTYRYGTNPIIVYDVSNPLNPEQIGTLNDPTQKSILNVVYAHKDAYTFAPYEGVFFRILGCCWHGVVGELVLEIPETLLQAGELAVIDHYVYLASSDGFYIVDVIDRFRPSLANALYPNAYFSDIVKANGFVYLLDWNNGLIILDVSDPVNPVEVGKWQQ